MSIFSTPLNYTSGKHAVRLTRDGAGVTCVASLEEPTKILGVTIPLAGTTFKIESAEDITRRLTLTRVALLGPFALLVRKTTAYDYLVVTAADGRTFTVPVPRQSGAAARTFVSKVEQLPAPSLSDDLDPKLSLSPLA